jgi:hypothetical protein
LLQLNDDWLFQNWTNIAKIILSVEICSTFFLFGLMCWAKEDALAETI